MYLGLGQIALAGFGRKLARKSGSNVLLRRPNIGDTKRAPFKAERTRLGSPESEGKVTWFRRLSTALRHSAGWTGGWGPDFAEVARREQSSSATDKAEFLTPSPLDFCNLFVAARGLSW